jgi:hypothetical protein
MEGFAAERVVVDHALGLGTIHELPGLADAAVGGEALAEVALEAPAAPDAIHEDGLEADRSGKAHEWNNLMGQAGGQRKNPRQERTMGAGTAYFSEKRAKHGFVPQSE